MTNISPTADRSRYRVPILDRTVALIELLSEHPEGLNVTELCESLSIPKNSAFRIAVTLEENGPSKAYRLTSKFMNLGASSVSDLNLFERSLDMMRSLRDDLRETVLLGSRIGSEGVVLDQVPGLHAFRFSVDPGIRFDLHTAAPGKAILACLSEDECRSVVEKMAFKRYNKNTITCPDKFMEHLIEVREQGFGFDLSEEMEGQYCVGAPIFDAKDYPIAAVWITAPSERLPDKMLTEVGERVRAAADVISGRFGWSQAD